MDEAKSAEKYKILLNSSNPRLRKFGEMGLLGDKLKSSIAEIEAIQADIDATGSNVFENIKVVLQRVVVEHRRRIDEITKELNSGRVGNTGSDSQPPISTPQSSSASPEKYSYASHAPKKPAPTPSPASQTSPKKPTPTPSPEKYSYASHAPKPVKTVSQPSYSQTVVSSKNARGKGNDKYGFQNMDGSGHCIDRSLVNLKESQKQVVRHFDNHDSLLLAWGTGLGKTMTAVAVAQCYLDQYPDNQVVVIAPATLEFNFLMEMRSKYRSRHGDNKFKFTTFGKIVEMAKRRINGVSKPEDIDCTNSLVIIDEVHNLKAVPSISRDSTGEYYFDTTKDNVEGINSWRSLECAMKSHKRLIMTATPFVNNYGDFMVIANLLHGGVVAHVSGTAFTKPPSKIDLERGRRSYNISTSRDVKTEDHTMKVLTEILMNKVSIQNERNVADFPERREKYIFVPMDPDYYKIYKMYLSFNEDKKKFYSIHRTAVNKADEYIESKYGLESQDFEVKIVERRNADGTKRRVAVSKGHSYLSKKILEIEKHINPHDRNIFFSNWIGKGLNILEEFLTKNGVKFDSIHGEVNKGKRIDIVDAYNRGDISSVIITKAGGEGLNFMRTKNMVILDPGWNTAGLEQVIGRSIRFRSHVELPPEERYVNVIKLVLTTPEDEGKDPETFLRDLTDRFKRGDKSMMGDNSGDVMLYVYVEDKKLSSDRAEKFLKTVDIFNASSEVKEKFIEKVVEMEVAEGKTDKGVPLMLETQAKQFEQIEQEARQNLYRELRDVVADLLQSIHPLSEMSMSDKVARLEAGVNVIDEASKQAMLEFEQMYERDVHPTVHREWIKDFLIYNKFSL